MISTKLSKDICFFLFLPFDSTYNSKLHIFIIILFSYISCNCEIFFSLSLFHFHLTSLLNIFFFSFFLLPELVARDLHSRVASANKALSWMVDPSIIDIHQLADCVPQSQASSSTLITSWQLSYNSSSSSLKDLGLL